MFKVSKEIEANLKKQYFFLNVDINELYQDSKEAQNLYNHLILGDCIMIPFLNLIYKDSSFHKFQFSKISDRVYISRVEVSIEEVLGEFLLLELCGIDSFVIMAPNQDVFSKEVIASLFFNMASLPVWVLNTYNALLNSLNEDVKQKLNIKETIFVSINDSISNHGNKFISSIRFITHINASLLLESNVKIGYTFNKSGSKEYKDIGVVFIKHENGYCENRLFTLDDPTKVISSNSKEIFAIMLFYLNEYDFKQISLKLVHEETIPLSEIENLETENFEGLVKCVKQI